jgi:hypothetical protein
VIASRDRGRTRPGDIAGVTSAVDGPGPGTSTGTVTAAVECTVTVTVTATIAVTVTVALTVHGHGPLPRCGLRVTGCTARPRVSRESIIRCSPICDIAPRKRDVIIYI